MQYIGIGDYLTIKGAAKLLGITTSGMYKRVDRDKIPSVVIGRSKLIKISELQTRYMK